MTQPKFRSILVFRSKQRVSFVTGNVRRTFSLVQLNKTNASDTGAIFLDLDLSIFNGFVSSEIYDTRDDFDFGIVNFPFLDAEIPRCSPYGVYISQLIWFTRVSSHMTDFNARYKCLTAKHLQHGLAWYHKLRKTHKKDSVSKILFSWLMKLPVQVGFHRSCTFRGASIKTLPKDDGRMHTLLTYFLELLLKYSKKMKKMNPFPQKEKFFSSSRCSS